MNNIELYFTGLINLDEVKRKLNDGFSNLIRMGDLDSISADFLADSSKYHTEFDCIRLYLFNTSKRPPYFMARLNIIENETNLLKAWYDQEYSLDIQVLDDYFDFY
jgi:hypothetical protein